MLQRATVDKTKARSADTRTVGDGAVLIAKTEFVAAFRQEMEQLHRDRVDKGSAAVSTLAPALNVVAIILWAWWPDRTAVRHAAESYAKALLTAGLKMAAAEPGDE